MNVILYSSILWIMTFPIAATNIKYLQINVRRNVQDLYKENVKPSLGWTKVKGKA